eukprot:150171-Chlamydomonas_euryale.AAC.1
MSTTLNRSATRLLTKLIPGPHHTPFQIPQQLLHQRMQSKRGVARAPRVRRTWSKGDLKTARQGQVGETETVPRVGRWGPLWAGLPRCIAKAPRQETRGSTME